MYTVTDYRNNAIQAVGLTADLYGQWLSYIDVKPKSAETYKRAISAFSRYMYRQQITQPSRATVIAWRDELRADHKPTTVQLYITAIRAFFRWTEQEGLYPNIADNVKGAKLNKEHKKDFLGADQVKHVLQTINTDTLQGKRNYAIVALMVTTGLRTIEVSRANIEDLKNLAGENVLYIQGKGRDEKAEYVKIVPVVYEAIQAYLQARTDDDSALFVGTSNHSKAVRLTTRSISAICKAAMQGAGYDSDRLTAHSLRHTAGTLNLQNGGTLEETRQLLRHTNINTTLIYVHDLDRVKNHSEERIAGAIF